MSTVAPEVIATAAREASAGPSAAAGAVVPAPIVTLDRVLLRPWHASDADALVREGNHPIVGRYMTNAFPSPYKPSDAEWWINHATTAPIDHFAICDRETGCAIGGCGLKDVPAIDPWTKELGYWIGPAHWGKGIMTEVVRGFARWAFETRPKLIRLEAGVFEGNLASENVLQKSGFQLEGRKRKALVKGDVTLDIAIYGLLREECEGLKVSCMRPWTTSRFQDELTRGRQTQDP